MLLRVDPQAVEPLFAQLVSQVRIAVLRGELKPGEQLPAARELAHSLDLNMHTVLRAYQQLRAEGLLDLRRGRGAVISSRADGDFTKLRAALDAVACESRSLALNPETTIDLLREALR